MNRDDDLATDHELAALLAGYRDPSVPQPADGFYERAILRAASRGQKRQRNRWLMTGFAGAAAAALAIWMASSVFQTVPEPAADSIPAVTMALEEPRTLNLVFSSTTALEGATMTVVLPEGVELAGFGGQRSITWMTSLAAGRNVLPLTLIATAPTGGELVATLRHDDDSKTFRLRMTVI